MVSWLPRAVPGWLLMLSLSDVISVARTATAVFRIDGNYTHYVLRWLDSIGSISGGEDGRVNGICLRCPFSFRRLSIANRRNNKHNIAE